MAAFLKHISVCLPEHENQAKKTAVTVITSATELEQIAMLEACFIARINAILIDESTATIYSYANDKMKELREMEIE